jgi:UDP-2-acetamido-2-deoxy-ribo-hexuluronate aminotransferase
MINFFYQDNNYKILNNINKYFKNDTWINGKIVRNFEKNIKKKLKTKLEPCACNSGSDALLLALMLNKNKKKDIYLTTPLSYIASSSMAKFLGLNLIYIDVCKNNYLLDLNKLESFLKQCPKKIFKRINGIINVELFGSANNLDQLNAISKKYNLRLIGDCSQSFGSKYKNQSTVNFYDFGIFSFYPTKLLSCYGDGGMLFVKKKLLKRAQLMRNNGHNLVNKDDCKILGLNSRLDSIQAYILNKKFFLIDNVIKKKSLFFSMFKKELPNYLKLPVFDNNFKSNNYILSVFIKKNIRNKFIQFMKRNKIECRTFYNKLISSNKVLEPIVKTDLTNAKKCSKTLVCIPTHERIAMQIFKKMLKKMHEFKSFI